MSAGRRAGGENLILLMYLFIFIFGGRDLFSVLNFLGRTFSFSSKHKAYFLMARRKLTVEKLENVRK